MVTNYLTHYLMTMGEYMEKTIKKQQIQTFVKYCKRVRKYLQNFHIIICKYDNLPMLLPYNIEGNSYDCMFKQWKQYKRRLTEFF
jgi:hypothetical protein